MIRRGRAFFSPAGPERPPGGATAELGRDGSRPARAPLSSYDVL